MAVEYSFKCDHCSASWFIAGEPSALMAGRTLPIVCNNCNEIEDRLAILEDGKDLPRVFSEECPECGSTDCSLWDFTNKPCPKCKTGHLHIDPSKGVILSD